MNIKNNLSVPIHTLKAAKSIVGGWTVTSKMPTISYSLPAEECKTGSKLREIKDTVCSDCYAMKGNYVRYRKAIKPAMYKRLRSINNPSWVDAMVYIMKNQKSVVNSGVFRWHDSGDIQSPDHLDKIIRIAIATPDIRHWLPTKESNWIQKYNKHIPKNLVIRLSGTFVDGKIPIWRCNTSTVVTDKDEATCRAFENDGKCGDCRQCWDAAIKNVAYFKH